MCRWVLKLRWVHQFRHQLTTNKVSIYVRRGGPNYQEGLRMMRSLGESLGVPIYVHGPEMFITGIGTCLHAPDNRCHA